MITYYGIPGTPNIVRFQDDDGVAHPLPAVGPNHAIGYAWGTLEKRSLPPAATQHQHQMSTLALSLVTHLLGNESKALLVYQRVKYRTLATLKSTDAWSITDEDLRKAIEDAATTDKDAAMAKAIVGRERGPIANAGGMTQVGVSVKWEKDSTAGRAQGREDAPGEDD